MTGQDDLLTGKSVLITGGAGFIGSHIADRIAPITELKVFDNFSSGDREHIPADATIVKGDIRDSNSLAAMVTNVDVVFHQAAQVSVQTSIKNPVSSHETNLDPSLTILETARGTDTRVIFASSASIYGEPEYTPIDEHHPKKPNSPYGLEKLTADHYCRLYHDLYDVDSVVLRYFNAYGPRQQGGDYSGVISIFRDKATSGEPITVEGDGSQTRDFVHVDDIVQANLLAASKDEAVGEAFNIGTGTQMTIRKLAETVQCATNTDSKITHVDGREGDIEESVADISKARDILDYDPKYDIEEGLNSYLGNSHFHH